MEPVDAQRATVMRYPLVAEAGGIKTTVEGDEDARRGNVVWLAKIVLTDFPGLELSPEFLEGCRTLFNSLFRIEMSFGMQGKA